MYTSLLLPSTQLNSDQLGLGLFKCTAVMILKMKYKKKKNNKLA